MIKMCQLFRSFSNGANYARDLINRAEIVDDNFFFHSRRKNVYFDVG